MFHCYIQWSINRQFLSNPAMPLKNQYRTHKQSQNNLSAVPSFEERIIQTPAFPQPSAEDIQRLLSNIGAGHRASLPTIESMIQKNNNAAAAAADNAADRPSTEITANEMIDLIAQIRSLWASYYAHHHNKYYGLNTASCSRDRTLAVLSRCT